MDTYINFTFTTDQTGKEYVSQDQGFVDALVSVGAAEQTGTYTKDASGAVVATTGSSSGNGCPFPGTR